MSKYDPRLEKIADDIWKGKYGKDFNGKKRKDGLGDDYAGVQAIINDKYYNKNKSENLNSYSSKSGTSNTNKNNTSSASKRNASSSKSNTSSSSSNSGKSNGNSLKWNIHNTSLNLDLNDSKSNNKSSNDTTTTKREDYKTNNLRELANNIKVDYIFKKDNNNNKNNNNKKIEINRNYDTSDLKNFDSLDSKIDSTTIKNDNNIDSVKTANTNNDIKKDDKYEWEDFYLTEEDLKNMNEYEKFHKNKKEGKRNNVGSYKFFRSGTSNISERNDAEESAQYFKRLNEKKNFNEKDYEEMQKLKKLYGKSWKYYGISI